MEVGPAVVSAVSGLVGSEVRLLGTTTRGESRSTFRVGDSLGDFIVNLAPDAPGVIENQHRLVRLVERLRSRGYPAPEHVGAGRWQGMASLDGSIPRVTRRSRATSPRRPHVVGPGEHLGHRCRAPGTPRLAVPLEHEAAPGHQSAVAVTSTSWT